MNDPIKWADLEDAYLAKVDWANPLSRPYGVLLIEAIMLWPDDLKWRTRAALASLTELGTRQLAVLTELTEEQAQEYLACSSKLLDWARQNLPLGDIKDEVKKERDARGLIAGSVLREMICAVEIDKGLQTVKEIAESVLSGFNEGRLQINASPDLKALRQASLKTFKNEIWPTFRSVAHFWAASIDMGENDESFHRPCPLDGLAEFLAAAEFFRLKGEALRMRRSKETFLCPDDAFPLPPNLKVEPYINWCLPDTLATDVPRGVDHRLDASAQPGSRFGLCLPNRLQAPKKQNVQATDSRIINRTGTRHVSLMTRLPGVTRASKFG